jgi:hypothetical protein
MNHLKLKKKASLLPVNRAKFSAFYVLVRRAKAETHDSLAKLEAQPRRHSLPRLFKTGQTISPEKTF